MNVDSALNERAGPSKATCLVPEHSLWNTNSWDCLRSGSKNGPPDLPHQSTDLHVTAQAMGSGYRVRVNGIDRCIRPAQFDYLLELLIAAYASPDCPELYIWDTVCTEGDHDRTRHAVQRLRNELANDGLIENNKRGGYRLTTPPTQIRLCDTLWRLPAQLVSPATVSELRKTHAAYWATLMSAPQGVFLVHQTQDVTPLSSTECESILTVLEIGLQTVVLPNNAITCQPGTHLVTGVSVCSTADFD